MSSYHVSVSSRLTCFCTNVKQHHCIYPTTPACSKIGSNCTKYHTPTLTSQVKYDEASLGQETVCWSVQALTLPSDLLPQDGDKFKCWSLHKPFYQHAVSHFNLTRSSTGFLMSSRQLLALTFGPTIVGAFAASAIHQPPSTSVHFLSQQSHFPPLT